MTTCRKDSQHEYRTTAKGGYCYTCDRVRAESEKAARKANKTTKVEPVIEPMSPAEAALAQLTVQGRQFMAMVGRHGFDFFEEGIVEHSGNWELNMAWQFALATDTPLRSVGDIMGRLAQSGLWSVNDHTWWSLTALGAEVALLAAKK
jgi:hypothetical protein